MILLAALAATSSLAVEVPVDYPVDEVWQSYTAFCDTDEASLDGWSKVDPAPRTSLAYLAEDPMWRLTGKEGAPATVFKAEVAGRSLYAFKRNLGTSDNLIRYCQAYDFDAIDRLDVSLWSATLGRFEKVDEREHTQKLQFDSDSNVDGLDGAILLHQPGYFPPLDSVGFVGLQIVTYTRPNS